ncbi:MAG: alpha/beta hydrolase [Pseudomonadota bacterium]
MRAAMIAPLLLCACFSVGSAQTTDNALDPEAAQLLEAFEQSASSTPNAVADDTAWVEMSREGYRQTVPLAGVPAEVSVIRDLLIEVSDRQIGARLYLPPNAEDKPLIVYFHGGGFTAGGLDTHDPTLRDLTAFSEAAVLAVSYRLAPEHPHPAALDDALAAYLWANEHAAELGARPTSVILMGDSAGGNIAAATALRIRDDGYPEPDAQILIYPNTDLRLDRAYASIDAFDGYVINRRDMDRNIRLYAAGGADLSSPYLSPLASSDLSGLPRTFIITAGADPLRDEGEAYAARLRDDGVHVTLTRYPGMVHGFFQMKTALSAADELMNELAMAVALVAADQRETK